jgi:hypothetical protein
MLYVHGLESVPIFRIFWREKPVNSQKSENKQHSLDRKK